MRAASFCDCYYGPHSISLTLTYDNYLFIACDDGDEARESNRATNAYAFLAQVNECARRYEINGIIHTKPSELEWKYLHSKTASPVT